VSVYIFLNKKHHFNIFFMTELKLSCAQVQVQPNTEKAFFPSNSSFLMWKFKDFLLFFCFFFVCEVVFFFFRFSNHKVYIPYNSVLAKKRERTCTSLFFLFKASWVEILLHLFQLHTPTRSIYIPPMNFLLK